MAGQTIEWDIRRKGPCDMNLSEDHIKRIDSLYFTPEERASAIYSVLHEEVERLEALNLAEGKDKGQDVPKPWDILIFAVEYISRYVASVPGLEELQSSALVLHQWTHGVHYSHPESLYGPPDRPQGCAGEPSTFTSDSEPPQ